jgi:hypothetical protein
MRAVAKGLVRIGFAQPVVVLAILEDFLVSQRIRRALINAASGK